jgi:hypothetical protein
VSRDSGTLDETLLHGDVNFSEAGSSRRHREIHNRRLANRSIELDGAILFESRHRAQRGSGAELSGSTEDQCDGRRENGTEPELKAEQTAEAEKRQPSRECARAAQMHAFGCMRVCVDALVIQMVSVSVSDAAVRETSEREAQLDEKDSAAENGADDIESLHGAIIRLCTAAREPAVSSRAQRGICASLEVELSTHKDRDALEELQFHVAHGYTLFRHAS